MSKTPAMKYGLWNSQKRRWCRGAFGRRLEFATQAEAIKAKSEITGRKRSCPMLNHWRNVVDPKLLPVRKKKS
jgi:hypothetical protein